MGRDKSRITQKVVLYGGAYRAHPDMTPSRREDPIDDKKLTIFFLISPTER